MSTPLTTPFQRIKVQNHLLGGTLISWDMRRNFRHTGNFLFTVQYAQNVQADDWENVNTSPVINVIGAVIEDPNRRIWANFPRIFYRVKLEVGTDTFYSEAQQAVGLLSRRDWLLTRKMARNEYLLHKKYGGANGYLLKHRQFGPVCPGFDSPITGKTVKCVDFDTEGVLNSHCPTCYGTGINCGYYESMELPLVLTQKSQDREINESRGTIEDVAINGRGLSWPIAEAKDVWIQYDTDQRYIVDSVTQPAEMRAVPLFQELTMRLAPTTDIIYSLPRTGSPCVSEPVGYDGYAYGYI